ncbi:MAG: GTPase ObgE [Bordetella sp.]|nr:MAG: GTPase ObgE [Bordetella sp.]
MKFVDEVFIEVIGGKGGNGIVSFRREKFIPKGGPDGGNGGNGGSIFAASDRNLNTLINFRYSRLYQAKNGKNGGSSNKKGANAKDIILHVPIGTVIYDIDHQQIISDLSKENQTAILALGGEGGYGNSHFKSSIRRTPRLSTLGKEGQHRRLRLELKILADIGLLGLPNAGKSSLISMLSNAKCKVANYPFTTLHPELGVVNPSSSDSFTIADIPGLIEGASKGVGLGHLFLRHLSRTRILLHIVDISFENSKSNSIGEIVHGAQTIIHELNQYDPKLAIKPRWLVLNKIDAVSNAEKIKNLFCKYLDWNGPVFLISSLSGEGLDGLTLALTNHLKFEKHLMKTDNLS